jgi:hypothetical protein
MWGQPDSARASHKKDSLLKISGASLRRGESAHELANVFQWIRRASKCSKSSIDERKNYCLGS